MNNNNALKKRLNGTGSRDKINLPKYELANEDIFISYSRKDLDIAEKIIDALKKKDFKPWIDWKSIPKGEKFESEIYHGIEKSNVFLFLISPDSIQSSWCNNEITHASENGKRILPVVVRDTTQTIIRPTISRRNWIFCRNDQDEFEKAIEEIYITIQTNYEWLKYHTKLQVKALDWNNGKDKSRLLRGKELREAELKLINISSKEYPQPTELQRQYLRLSRQNEERQRRQITIGLSVGLIILLILSIFAWGQRNEANSKNHLALARQLVAQAQSLSTTENIEQSVGILLAVQSMKISPSVEAEQILRNDFLAYPVYKMPFDNAFVAFSPNGELAASGGCDESDDNTCVQGTIHVWQTSSAKEVAYMTLGDSVISIAFSPDGKYIVSSSYDKTVRVWEISTGKEVSRMTYDSQVNSASFSFDGIYIVSSGDKTAHVWDAKTGEELSRMNHADWVTCAIFSPDGRYVASGDSGANILLWDVKNGHEIAQMTQEADVTSLAFSPDGKFLASGSGGYDDIARVWAISAGQEITQIAEMPHNNKHIKPGGMSAGAATLPVVVAFSPDSKYVVSGGPDNTARVWEATTGHEISHRTMQYTIESVAFSPDGRYVGAASNIASVWLTSTGEEVARTTEVASNIAFSPNNHLIISGGGSVVGIWDIDNKPKITGMNHAFPISSLSYNQDGSVLASGSWDRTACLWNANTGQKIDCIPLIEQGSPSVVVSSDSKYVVSTSFTSSPIIWNTRAREMTDVLMPNSMPIKLATFRQSNNFNLYIQSDEDTIDIWDMPSGNATSYRDFNSDIVDIVSSKDGKYAVASLADNTINVWDTTDGHGIAQINIGNKIDAISISSDGNYIVAIDNKAMHIWNVLENQKVIDIKVENIQVVAFSPDGKYIVSGGADTRVWKVSSGLEVAHITSDSPVTYVLFSPDGQHIATGDFNGTIIKWLWNPDDLIQDACTRLRRNLTRSEWQQYIGDALSYQATCPDLPIELESIPIP